MNDELCDQCNHDNGRHVLLTFGPEGQAPEQGGIALCPVKKCLCFKTWAVQGFSTRESVRELVPSESEIAELRRIVQGV